MKRNAREDEDGDDGRDAQEALVSEAYRTAEADTGLLTGVRESSLIVQAGKKGSRIIASHAASAQHRRALAEPRLQKLNDAH